MKPVRFHLPGLRYNYPLNMFWISLLKQYPEYFREGVEIASIFGCFPFALWNGGRLVTNDQCDSAFVTNVIKNINAAGVPIRYTFTNPLLTKEDLKDPFCNFCMDAANNGMNEVMIMSPILEEYLREKYPSYKYNSSTCKEIKNAQDLQEELNRDYQYVVLDYNLNGHWELIDGLENVEKLEVLVNTLCVPNCKRRGEHYRHIAKAQKIIKQNEKIPPEHRMKYDSWYCEYGEKNCLYTIQDYPTFISVDAIWNEYLPRGINNFKIEGRTASLFSLIETYCYYMIKPECVGPARLLLLKNLENMKVITVNKPRPSKWP